LTLRGDFEFRILNNVGIAKTIGTLGVLDYWIKFTLHWDMDRSILGSRVKYYGLSSCVWVSR
jgi:hypothetical protein